MKKIWAILIFGATIIAGAAVFFINQPTEKTTEQVSPETPAKTEPLGVTTSTESQETKSENNDKNESVTTETQQTTTAAYHKNNNTTQIATVAKAETSQANTVNVAQDNQTNNAVLEEEPKTAEEIKIEQIKETIKQATHPNQYIDSGTNAYAGVSNSYPWRNDCPSKQDTYVTYFKKEDGTIIKIGGYVCECTSYASWKVYEAYEIALDWGQSYSWDDRARMSGYIVDNIPAAHTIGQTDSGYYGQVFWVESVNGDGSINVTEYNNYYSTGLYSGSYHVGDFGSRVIPASEASRYNYIHFESETTEE